MALAGFPNPRTIPNLPDVTVLFHDADESKVLPANKFTALLNKLFMISLPEFRGPNGRHRQLLLVVTGVMIMNYRYCEQKYGSGHRSIGELVRERDQTHAQLLAYRQEIRELKVKIEDLTADHQRSTGSIPDILTGVAQISNCLANLNLTNGQHQGPPNNPPPPPPPPPPGPPPINPPPPIDPPPPPIDRPEPIQAHHVHTTTTTSGCSSICSSTK
ncbi:unknown protein [Seminavis robusta]|uniref:Uncharacterized protein n=1 Tax=Seminavis robusta TaxID=568900 RepID=A0A9N8H4R8_9STRA|nr:unknown protein [Seminavis robusta]|eukprot:Sro121_g059020.1 n/a (216) ;mRNA; r:103890-104722